MTDNAKQLMHLTVYRPRLRGFSSAKDGWLMLNSRVLFDQQLDQSVKQGFSSFPDIMDELEKTKIERKLFL